jgi:hypothetical protein
MLPPKGSITAQEDGGTMPTDSIDAMPRYQHWMDTRFSVHQAVNNHHLTNEYQIKKKNQNSGLIRA